MNTENKQHELSPTNKKGVSFNPLLYADVCRLEYHSKQSLFHMAQIGDARYMHTGWMTIMENIPEMVALEFIDYADENLLATNEYYTWRMIQKELHKWLEK